MTNVQAKHRRKWTLAQVHRAILLSSTGSSVFLLGFIVGLAIR